ncbi:MAG: N-acetylmuramoyl-L-alanine amidase [Clostridia bacterium]|nr:N-acetylmuramoyl-L-alanine amidase [Clostridia bacterium]
MRKLCVSFIAIMMFLFCNSAFAVSHPLMLEYDGGTHEYNGEVYSLVVNNQLLDPPLSPIVFNDRALVPVREIFEEVGATVNYIGDTQTIEVFNDDSYVRLRINDNVAYINGDRTNIPDNVVPKLIAKVGGETKTMVPVRFISETIGLDVEFDANDGAIIIDSAGYTMTDESQAPTVDEVIVPQEPVVEENYVVETTPCVTDVSYGVVDDKSVMVKVVTDIEATDLSDFVLNSPERVILDIAGAKLSGVGGTINVNASGVSSIRLGDNDERARIVIDVNSLVGYEVRQVSATEIGIYVITEGVKEVATPAPTKTPEKKPDQQSQSTVTIKPDSSKLIVLDAGHGGTDPGAVGYLNGNKVLEKNLTLEITNRVKTILENAGYTVSMTREGDTLPSLSERPAQANAEDAAVFVSIHINAVDNAPEANGTEVFYATENNGDEYGATSKELAKNILDRMLYYMGSTNRGVKSAEHAVTRKCYMPAALAEVGFITNPEEVYKMTTDEYQQKAAQGIAEGIMITLKDIEVPEVKPVRGKTVTVQSADANTKGAATATH